MIGVLLSLCAFSATPPMAVDLTASVGSATQVYGGGPRVDGRLGGVGQPTLHLGMGLHIGRNTLSPDDRAAAIRRVAVLLAEFGWPFELGPNTYLGPVVSVDSVVTHPDEQRCPGGSGCRWENPWAETDTLLWLGQPAFGAMVVVTPRRPERPAVQAGLALQQHCLFELCLPLPRVEGSLTWATGLRIGVQAQRYGVMAMVGWRLATDSGWETRVP